MPIPTKPSISGFVRFDPELSYTKDGVARLYMPVGIKQSIQDKDDKWHEIEPYRTSLVMFGESAERAHVKFKAGDNFLAEGSVRTYEGKDGQEREEFRASRIGHDNNLAAYTVERRSAEREAETRDAPERGAAQRNARKIDPAPEVPSDDPVAEVLAQRQDQVAPEPVGAGTSGPAAHEAVAR